MSKSIYDEALADAKQLKALAEDNAKKAVIDAVSPKIKELIEKQLLDDDSINESVNSYLFDDGVPQKDYALEVLSLEESLNEISKPLSFRNISELKKELHRVTDMAESLDESLLKVFESLQKDSTITQKKKAILESRLEEINKNLHSHREQTMGKLKDLFEQTLTINFPDDKMGSEITPEEIEVLWGDGGDQPVEMGGQEPGAEGMPGAEAGAPPGGEMPPAGGPAGAPPGQEQAPVAERRFKKMSYKDNTVIEISESMLKSEINRLRSKRKLMESEQNLGFSGEEQDVIDLDDLDNIKLNASDGHKGRTSIPQRPELQLEMDEEDDDILIGGDDSEDFDMKDFDSTDDGDWEGEPGTTGDMDDEGMSHGGFSMEGDSYESALHELDLEEETEDAHAKQGDDQQPFMDGEEVTEYSGGGVPGSMSKEMNEARSYAQLRKVAERCYKESKLCYEKKMSCEKRGKKAEATQWEKKARGLEEKKDFYVRKAEQAKLRETNSKKLKESAEYFAGRTSQLKEKLEESNLFNAKLLCCNKLLQNESLTARQKASAIERLDEAQSVREVKLVYESIVKALGREKSKINESARGGVGSSSRPVSSGGASVLNEGAIVDRWAKLAGIK